MPSGLFGDWERAKEMINNLSMITPKSKKILSEIGKEIEVKVKDNIKSGAFNFAPYSPSYGRRTLDERFFIDTGEFVENIKVLDVFKEEDHLVVIIGGSSEERHHSGLSFAELAKYLEEGTIEMPPRPVFQLTWEEMRSNISHKVLKEIQSIIIRG